MMAGMSRRGIVTPLCTVAAVLFVLAGHPVGAGFLAGWASYRWMTP